MWALLGLAVLAGRLFQLQLLNGSALAAAGRAERLQKIVLPASRGEITDRNGQVLALSVPAALVTADPAFVTHPAAEARALAPVLGLSAAGLAKSLGGKGQYAVLASDVTTAQATAVDGLHLAGVYTRPLTVRRYPDGFFMGHILGFVNVNGGAAGVEQSYQQALAGQSGYELAQTDPYGQVIPGTTVRTVPPTPGLTLRLTVDAGLQADLQRYLEAAIATTGASRAYGVVLQPATGAILAASTWPTFDPNAYGNAPSTWANTIQGQDLTPGSVFKPITAAAALEAGVVTPTTPFVDSGTLTVGGVTIHNFQTLAKQTTFTGALEESANVVFGRVGLELGLPRFYSALAAFGLTGAPGSDLPGGQPNILVPEATAKPLDLAEESFGETLSVTPLGLAEALNAIVDGGRLIRPHVGLALVDASGQVVRRVQPQVVRQVVSPEVAAAVRQMMVGVVEDGTGQRAFIPCYTVGGKTGTANIYSGGRLTNQYVASFVGFAPASDPAALALVMLYDPHGRLNEGGEVAAPVVQAVLSDAMHVLGVPPHCTPANSTPPEPGRAGGTPLLLHMVTMPAVVGMTPAQASAALQKVGLVAQLSGSGPRVLRQNPPPGATVQEYTAVSAYTTPGALNPPGFAPVPAVKGDDVADARNVLSQAGFTMVVTGAGTATAEDPPPGTLAAPGSSVQVQFAGTA